MGDDQSGDASATEVQPEQQVQQPAVDQTATDGSQPQTSQSPNEDLFNQAALAYQSGDFPGAIGLMNKLIYSGLGSDDWGRAVYGVVMCYDSLGDYANAKTWMDNLLTSMPAKHPNRPSYEQQRDGYAHGQRWTGDYLLY